MADSEHATDTTDSLSINTGKIPVGASHLPSPTALNDESPVPESTTIHKKKKKKKSKKSTKAKECIQSTPSQTEGRPPVLCISRNKHWKYISSYHGPWLQLPVELLESLLSLNLDPTTFAPEPRTPTGNPPKQKERFNPEFSPPDSPGDYLPLSSTLPLPKPGKATPPPIDPGVFRSVTSIRRLIDEASELSVRASSGLSASELGSLRGNGMGGLNGGPWAAAHTLGINPLGNPNGNGRNVAMSAMRIHRLRALAVQKLAQAYKTDEVASSVMVMQGGSVFEDVAERVLKHDPNDVDAKYVHFFHEKIPSRQLAESTTTCILDELIHAQPQRLEFYRTRGVVHCFRDEYPEAIRDLTIGIRESRTARKARMGHTDQSPEPRSRGKKKRKGPVRSNGQAPPSGTSYTAIMDGTVDGDLEPLILHPSVLPDAPEPIESQCLFLRGAAYLQQAVFIIENAVLELEGIKRGLALDGAELRLCYIEGGKYGGIEIGNPEGPLGAKTGVKLLMYRQALSPLREQISNLLKRSIRDHEKFLSHFDTLESQNFVPHGDLAQQTEYAFLTCEMVRPGNPTTSPHMPDALTMFTTYHPLLVESHFSILIAQLMLADFSGILPRFIRTASLVDGLEGYPVFLPPRSMAQAEFIEVLDRLASGWDYGIQPHSLSRSRAKDKLTIESAPVTPLTSTTPSDIGSSSSHINGHITELPFAVRDDAVDALDSARILLAPVIKRRLAKAASGRKKPMAINIPLHGPRVEVILAWMAAVHLPEL